MPTTVYLKSRRAKPFFCHHPWLFSGAIERIDGDAPDGSIVEARSHDSRFIGRGYINRKSQITVRLLTWREDEPIDEAFWRRRIAAAVALRSETLRTQETGNACRVVNSEGDGLSGLVVDRYADRLVVQLLTLGTIQRREMLCDALDACCQPVSIHERAELVPAAAEGVAPESGLRRGEEVPDIVEINENGLRFLVDLKRGHKTGAYLDQSENRAMLAGYTQGKRVLDCFTYNAGFAVHAAASGGAESVLAVDSSSQAIERASANVEANGLSNVTCQVQHVDVALRELRTAGERFGVVVLDPPKFARSRGGLRNALRAYRQTNLLAMQVVEPGGLLFTCSCSQYVDDDTFCRTLNEAAIEASKTLRVLRRASQPADHPVVAACPETRYLKAYLCHVQDV